MSAEEEIFEETDGTRQIDRHDPCDHVDEAFAHQALGGHVR